MSSVKPTLIAERYRLDERLGAGSTSEVWAATDLELDRRVALKLLAADADPVRFEREARAIAALAHPNICAVYAFGETDGRPFIVLEYLPGGSLDERMTYGKPVPDAVADQLARDIAAGLAHAHERGIVHRDLKPANVLFAASGHTKIADFGLARLGGSPSLTAAGTVLGTAAYIAPEQVEGTARHAGDRRLLVRRAALPDAHRAVAVRGRGRRHAGGRCTATGPRRRSSTIGPTRPHCSRASCSRRWRRARTTAPGTEAHCFRELGVGSRA